MPNFNNNPKTYHQYYKSRQMMGSDPNLTFDSGFEAKDKWVTRYNRQTDNLAAHGNKMGMSKNWQSALSSAGSLIGGLSGSTLPEEDKAVREGIRSAIGSLGPQGAIVSAVTGAVDALGDIANINLDSIDMNAAKRAGVKEGAMFNKVVNMIPGASAVLGLFGRNTENAYFSADAQKIGAGYGGSVQALNDAQALGNKRMLLGSNKTNDFINKANKINDKLTDLSLDAKRMENNKAGEMMSINDQLKYSGYKPGLSLAKKGGTIPELESARASILSLQSEKQEIQEPQKFQLGGKMNMIVTGALHARKHNLEELNPVLEGEITKKGIPVITFDEGGEVDQQLAEVEQAEIIMTLDTTKTIEDYYKEYMDADTNKAADKAALECGKFLVDQILKNTDDPDKLIKQVK